MEGTNLTIGGIWTAKPNLGGEGSTLFFFWGGMESVQMITFGGIWIADVSSLRGNAYHFPPHMVLITPTCALTLYVVYFCQRNYFSEQIVTPYGLCTGSMFTAILLELDIIKQVDTVLECV